MSATRVRNLFFSKCKLFAVVGASADRSKFGNKVLRAYIDNAMPTIPINKIQSSIENLVCLPSLSVLASTIHDVSQRFGSDVMIEEIGVSIITPPTATMQIVDEGYTLGMRNFFFQPGTIAINDINLLDSRFPDAQFVHGCVLVDLGWHH